MTLILHQHDLVHDGNPASIVTNSCSWAPCHSVVTRIYLRCHSAERPDSGLQGIPAIAQHYHTCHHLYNSIFQFLCQVKLRQNGTKQNRKELNCRCFGKI